MAVVMVVAVVVPVLVVIAVAVVLVVMTVMFDYLRRTGQSLVRRLPRGGAVGVKGERHLIAWHAMACDAMLGREYCISSFFLLRCDCTSAPYRYHALINR
jgi:hypothetical protein